QGLGRFVRLPPEDAGAALGADDRVVGVLEHAHAVADADAQRPAGAPLADHDAHDGRLQPRHLHEVVGDQLRLPALLRADARVGAPRVDQADDRQPELGRHAHAAQRLAVALRVGAAVEALAALLGGPALLVPQEHDAVIAQPGEAGPD